MSDYSDIGSEEELMEIVRAFLFIAADVALVFIVRFGRWMRERK